MSWYDSAGAKGTTFQLFSIFHSCFCLQTGFIAVQLLKTQADLVHYDRWVRAHPQGTLWQSVAWRQYQQALGKEVRIYAAKSGGEIQASALIVIDRTSFGLSTWDCPRGPVTNDELRITNYELMERMVADAKKSRCMSLYLSPLTPLITDHLPLITSQRHEQPQATIVIDLQQNEEDILKQMHPKGRYNIRLAEKHGVEIRESTDIDAFYHLIKQTGNRDGFGVHQKSHYSHFLENLDGSFMLMATHEKKPIAGLLGVEWNGTCIYYYGASDHTHRQLMAPYLLQWEAMRRAKLHHCHTYDLLGIAPPGAGRENSWTGITDFKRKFGGTMIEYPAEQQIVLRPVTRRLLAIKRRFW